MTNKHTSWEVVCGMEVHAELKTASKMFCGCPNDPFNAEKPNIYTCPVCLGMPGGLPVPNQKAIEWTIKLGLALGCEINLISKFDRKHYFYPDLPKGYQISQYDIPFCVNGVVETTSGPVRIHRIHLEEDTAKLHHTTVEGKKVSLVDFNRSSVPLIEIVTEPDITSAQHAKEYAKALRTIIKFLDISDCDMDQGGMRLEANISIRKPGSTELPNYKVEVKNINSFRFVEQAIEYETTRQAALLEKGVTPPQETRGWNSNKQQTFVQRSKETAEDYRYIPDPDIPPLHLTEASLQLIKASLPELPDEVSRRWKNTYSFTADMCSDLIETAAKTQILDDVFTAATAQNLDPKKIAHALINDPFGQTVFASATELLESYQKEYSLDEIDTLEVDAAISQAFVENPDETIRFKNGELKLQNFFIGQTMRILKKKIDMKLMSARLDQLIKQQS